MISIIVPVYNTKDYLAACIESILKQTVTEWELLLIDDGSTDGSGEVCDDFQRRDSRVRAIHKSNAGVSAARNTGLDLAQGEFIVFVDSDDTVDPDYLADMLNVELRTGADIVCSGWRTSEGTVVKLEDKFIERLEFSYFFCSYTNFGYVWGKLIKRSLFVDNDIRFPVNVHWAEDTLVVDSLILKAKSAAFVSSVNYNYTIRPGSGVATLHGFESEKTGFLIASQVMPQLDELLPSKHLNSTFGYLWRTVLCLYKEEPERNKRLGALKALPIAASRLWHKPTNKKEHLITWLLKHRLFLPFDLLMSRIYR